MAVAVQLYVMLTSRLAPTTSRVATKKRVFKSKMGDFKTDLSQQHIMTVPKPGAEAYNTDEARTFKRVYQTVGRPQVTDHDIHEDMIKDPPVVRIRYS